MNITIYITKKKHNIDENISNETKGGLGYHLFVVVLSHFSSFNDNLPRTALTGQRPKRKEHMTRIIRGIIPFLQIGSMSMLSLGISAIVTVR